MNKKNTKRQFLYNRGIALFVAVLTAGIALAIGAGVMNITLKELKLSLLGRESTEAFFAADTGFECALYWDDVKTYGSPSGIFGIYGADVVTSGLIGYWKFDGDATDSIGSNDGTVVGNPTWDSGGKFEQALSFDPSDGINDYVNLGSAVEPGTGDFSVAFWYKGLKGTPEDFISYPDVFGNLWYITDTKTTFNRSGIVTSVDYVLPDGGTWHSLIITLDRSTSPDTLIVYVDGVSQGTITSQQVDGEDFSNVNRDTNVGRPSWINEGGYRKGLIDDLRIYNRVLPQADVDELYTAVGSTGFSPPVLSLPSGTYSCALSDLSDGWGVSNIDIPTGKAETVFNIADPCATVTVKKDNGNTTVDSRGYNTCDTNSPRRVERGVSVTY